MNTVMRFLVSSLLSLSVFLSGPLLYAKPVQAQTLFKITVFGDSIAQYGTTQPQNEGWVKKYSNYLYQDLHTTAEITNKAVPATRSSDLLAQIQNFSQDDKNKFITNSNLILIFIGINDFGSARQSYLADTCGGADNQDCLRSAVTNLQANYNAIHQEIITLNPNANVKVADFYYFLLSWDQDSGDFDTLNSYMTQMNNIIHTSSNQFNWGVANVHEAYNGPSGTQDPYYAGYISADLLHPSNLGHTVIADKFREIGYANLDNDNDGDADATDNCPGLSNPDQANFNSEITDLGSLAAYDDATNPIGDNLGDACDNDDDSDGLSDEDEVNLFFTEPLNPDTDGDLVRDNAEVICGSDPILASSKPSGTHSDGDMLPDSCEVAAGTNPNLNDTDGDGLSDGNELLYKGTDPLSQHSDSDGCRDDVEVASVNGDRTVSAIDLGQLAQRFLTGTNSSHFNFNGDGSGITSIDLSQVAQRFGQSCSPLQ